jgi:hypothetical protein
VFFICFVSLWKHFMHLWTVWNDIELVLYWCILTFCIFFTWFYIFHQFNIFWCYAGLFYFHQFFTSLVGTYELSLFALGWCYSWLVSVFLIFLSSSCISFWCQLKILKMYLSIHTTNDPVACILFCMHSSVFGITLLTYSNFLFVFMFCIMGFFYIEILACFYWF